MSAPHSSDGVTLKDVIVHMQHMEQRLTSDIRGLKQDFSGMKANMRAMENRLNTNMNSMEKRLTIYIDEDLGATMKDVYEIQLHLGLRTAED